MKTYCKANYWNAAIDFLKYQIGRTVISRINRINVLNMLKNKTSVKLEIGSCWRPNMPGWYFLDKKKGADIRWDVTWENGELPFPNDVVDCVYSHHFLEHLNAKQIVVFLKSCYRIMKRGGLINIGVPNARFFIDCYLNSSAEQFIHSDGLYVPALEGLSRKAKIDYINYIAYLDGNHKHMFDGEGLIVYLIEAGFKNVRTRAFDENIDTNKYKQITVYVVGVK